MPEKKEKAFLRRLITLFQQTNENYVVFLKKWNLSSNTYWVLEYLYHNPQGAEPAELADAVGVMRQLITIILNDLEKRGCILRKESKDDHRRRKIMLSKHGQSFAREVCDAVDELDLQSLSTFSEEERNLILEHSQRFCDALKSAMNSQV